MSGAWKGAVALGVAALAIAVTPAWASDTWAWPAGTTVALDFASSWTNAEGVSCTHGGVDLAARDGEVVRAPHSGTVVFAGEVPAAGGGRTRAVTIVTADGLRVACMPLERAGVHAGDTVSTGDRLGDLAATGDGSSSGPHVHLSVKRGDAALDPMGFLGAAPDNGESGLPPVTANSGSSARPEVGGGTRVTASAVPQAGAWARTVSRPSVRTVDLARIQSVLHGAVDAVCAVSMPQPVLRCAPTVPSVWITALDAYRGAWGGLVRLCVAVVASIALLCVLARPAGAVLTGTEAVRVRR